MRFAIIDDQRLKQRYEREDWLEILANLLPDDFEQTQESIGVSSTNKYAQSITKLGQVNSLDLHIYEIYHQSENDPRVSLSREAFRLLADFSYQRALIFFVPDPEKSPNFRLSLVTVELKERDKRKVTREYSNPRRFSFFLGPDAKVHTPAEFLFKKGKISDFEDLKNRFSVEVVNKEFYNEIAKLFTELVGGERKIGSKKQQVTEPKLKYPGNDDSKRKEFAVRLIGRLVFCWFLKKKKSIQSQPIIPEDVLSLQAIESNTSGGFFHSKLEPLFFEVLNTPQDQRIAPYNQKPWKDIPFLNGGLFTPQDDDYYEPGEQGISRNIGIIDVPDDWLGELFSLFETYNFTIDENTPVDIELSVDPEMLGRIFENLLAEINPETGQTARKATGSYYTPRPIVEYMVAESLKYYLHQQTEISEDRLKDLLDYASEETDLTDAEKAKIINAIDKVKILDPACGSGAFPMGMLQKMLLVLKKVDPDSSRWKEKILARISEPEVKKKLSEKLESETLEYIHKLGLIRDAIYGVDIQPIATEISKLRAFLSLVVDENVDDNKRNRGIEPLPNLEFKFVCANTLISLPERADEEKGKQQTMFEATEEIEQLRKVITQYFISYGDDKKKLEQRFYEIQSKLRQHLINWGKTNTQTAQLADWDPFKNTPCPWFDPEWMFGIKDSFDIVISNPPYLNSRSMSKLDATMRKQIQEKYSFTKGSWDIYIAFFERGLSMLNLLGVLTYITPDKWLAKPFGETMRIRTISNIVSITKAGRDIFESANVDSVVSIFLNAKQERLHIYEYMNNKPSLKAYIHKNKITSPYTYDWLFSDYADLLSKINILPNKLSMFGICESSCATDDAYKLKTLIEECVGDYDPNLYFKIINTGTISKYLDRWGYSTMTYLGNKYKAPVVKKNIFLRRYKNVYAKRSISPKIILKGLNLLDACLDIKGIVIPGIPTLVIVSDTIETLKFLLALVNSKLIEFYIKEKYSGWGYNKGISFTKSMINNIPLPQISNKQRDFITILVNRILSLTQSKDYLDNLEKQAKVKEYKHQIDQLVYKLYNLTDEEIKIVEGKD